MDAVLVRTVSVTEVSDPGPPVAAAGGSSLQPAEGEDLTADELAPLVTEAIARWSAAGLDRVEVEELRSAEVLITDLPGATLGMASDTQDTIWIDVDAAGYGWFVDETPAEDEEFALVRALGELEASQGDAANQMDLLTVLAHELGHLLGHDDLDPVTHAHDLMAATLGTGVRRMPTAESDSAESTLSESASEFDPIARAQVTAPITNEEAHDAVLSRLDETFDLRSELLAGDEAENSHEDRDPKEELWWLLYGD
jgi:hypothetical protein